MSDVAHFLGQIESGDGQAAGKLLPLLYDHNTAFFTVSNSLIADYSHQPTFEEGHSASCVRLDGWTADEASAHRQSQAVVVNADLSNIAAVTATSTTAHFGDFRTHSTMLNGNRTMAMSETQTHTDNIVSRSH